MQRMNSNPFATDGKIKRTNPGKGNSETTERLDVEESETCLHRQTLTNTVCMSSIDKHSVYVVCSGSAHAQPHTAHFVQLSFTYLPVTIETRRRRMQKAGWQTDMQETWAES